MIRKITLSLLLLCLVVSCGKKGDPKYEEQKKTEIKKIFIKIA